MQSTQLQESPCVLMVFMNIQSHNHVFPAQLLMAKETNDSYEAFKDFFKFFSLAGGKSKSREGTPFFWDEIEGFEEIELTATMNMSASWKGLQKGGAYKQRRCFCHCCPLESDNVHHPNKTKYNHFCSSRDDEDLFCYHRSITSEQQLQKMKEDISVIQSKLLESVEDIEKKTF